MSKKQKTNDLGLIRIEIIIRKYAIAYTQNNLTFIHNSKIVYGNFNFIYKSEILTASPSEFNFRYQEEYKIKNAQFWNTLFTCGVEAANNFLSKVEMLTLYAYDDLNQKYKIVQKEMNSLSEGARVIVRRLALIKLMSQIALIIFDRAGVITSVFGIVNTTISETDKYLKREATLRDSVTAIIDNSVKDYFMEKAEDLTLKGSEEIIKKGYSILKPEHGMQQLIEFLRIQLGNNNLADDKTFNHILKRLHGAEDYLDEIKAKKIFKIDKKISFTSKGVSSAFNIAAIYEVVEEYKKTINEVSF